MRGYHAHPWGNRMDPEPREKSTYTPTPRDYESTQHLARALVTGTVPDGTYRLSLYGDGRLDLPDAKLTRGYVVGGVFGSVPISGPGLRHLAHANQYVGEAMEYAGARASGDFWSDEMAMYLGVWTDPKSGVREVELVEHVETEGIARSVGRNRGEKAIWDCANAVAIYL